MGSFYRSFAALANHELENRDYRVTLVLRKGPVLVMAPHGGKIEPGTSEIAQAIAGEEYSLYRFEGMKENANPILHIESHLFDEPRALQAIQTADFVITIHGQIDQKQAFVMVGGLHRILALKIEEELQESGFSTRPPTEGLGGTDRMNLCNRGNLGLGVQLEISRKIRDAVRRDGDRLLAFASAIRRGIEHSFLEERQRDG